MGKQRADNIMQMPFPLKGLVTNTALSQQPPGSTVSCLNVRGYNPRGGRDEGGQRSGLSQYMPQTVAGLTSNVQDINHLVTNLTLPTSNTGQFVATDTITASFGMFTTTGTLLAGLANGETYRRADQQCLRIRKPA